MPLDAINRASAREKSIRHGHPSTLHLWWARRPLAACRAVLFAQLVDDPSGWPEEFPTEEGQKRERARLHGIIAEMVPWEATNDRGILNRSRFEIARSLARARGEAPPPPGDEAAVLAWLREHAPPVCDPFCGGGSIPLEAQRLGLRAYGSDLNPVAVLISKATCEIPPKFAGRPAVNPDRDPHVVWKGAQGLAEDIRYYGKWMRDEAEKRIGHLYSKVEVTEAMARNRADLKPYVGRELTVIAWLWARTVASPDPMMRGAHVPLVSSFVLSSKKDREAIVVPTTDRESRTYRFTVRSGGIDKDTVTRAKRGTKTELAIALKKRKSALASSIVLVCRKRPPDAPVITRREFISRLRATLPPALEDIRAGGVGPVDMAQASIGPGMGVFTACSKVLEPDDAPMTVRTAIALINQVRDEISGEETGSYDADTRFCIDWFEAFGLGGGKAGDAITMAQAYDIGIDRLESAGVFTARGGEARLLRRSELPADWRPEIDARLTHWECAQHLARALEVPEGGIGMAGRLLAGMSPDDAGAARGLAYRLYDICERQGRADEAQVWNTLAREWPAIEADALRLEAERSDDIPELDLQGGR